MLQRRTANSASPPHSGLVHGIAQAPSISESDITSMFSINVHGLINMTQAILPIFKARDSPEHPGGRGDIINIGSIAGREGYPGGSIYCATKAAVRTFGEALRKELVNTRIRVMEVCCDDLEFALGFYCSRHGAGLPCGWKGILC